MNTIRLPLFFNVKNRIVDRFLGLTIATRMALAYLPLSVIIILILVYTLSTLNELGNISRSIVANNMVVIEAADSMTQDLLAQEAYGRRYLIMKSDEMKDLFWARSSKVEDTLKVLGQVDGLDAALVKHLETRHGSFNALYMEIFNLPKSALDKASTVYDGQLRQSLDDQFDLIKVMAQDARAGLSKKTRQSDMSSIRAFHVAALLSVLGICIGIGSAYLITRNMSRSIRQLKLAAEKYSERQFDFIPDLKQKDEFGMLAKSFIAMAQRLARLEMMDLDASPLTRLPGGIAIENVLNVHLKEGQALAFCLVDIDNFKSFNDRYGYVRGNEVIRGTGRILEAAIAEHGDKNAFLGHIGGDDFAIIVHPDRYQPVCQAIIDMFDRKVGEFYDPEDRARGYITSKTRQGNAEQFPIMTLSIAVVINTNQRYVSSVKIGEVAAEIKEYAKTIPSSLFLVDRRENDPT